MELLSAAQRIFIYQPPVDMRKSFTGLIGVTERELQEDSLSGDLYVFCNKRGNYIKILKWDRNGYVLYCKRLERGRFKVSLSSEKQFISKRQLSFLLDGLPLGISR